MSAHCPSVGLFSEAFEKILEHPNYYQSQPTMTVVGYLANTKLYSARTQNTVDIERHRKLEFRAGVLQHSGIILDQHIL